VSKLWRSYALHILDAIDKIRRIQAPGDLTEDEILYDATLRNLQTLSEATQCRSPGGGPRPQPGNDPVSTPLHPNEKLPIDGHASLGPSYGKGVERRVKMTGITGP
jgi:hypothetical protein